jgi:hypothetical protein
MKAYSNLLVQYHPCLICPPSMLLNVTHTLPIRLQPFPKNLTSQHSKFQTSYPLFVVHVDPKVLFCPKSYAIFRNVVFLKRELISCLTAKLKENPSRLLATIYSVYTVERLLS